MAGGELQQFVDAEGMGDAHADEVVVSVQKM